MEMLLGTFRIVSDKTISNVFVNLVPRSGVCMCICVLCE